MDFIWEFYQQGKIIDASANANRALSKNLESSANIASLERRLHRLFLLNRAIWELVREKTSLTDADLMEEIKKLDLMDGKVVETKKCSNCSTILAASATSCYSCGAQSTVTSIFHSY